MNKIFNLKQYKELRQKLRRDAVYSEKKLWQRLKGKQLGFKFRRQHGIGPYTVDFYCPKLKLIIEVDGITHEYPDMAIKDKLRSDYLINKGFFIRRYCALEVASNTDDIINDILVVIEILTEKPLCVSP